MVHGWAWLGSNPLFEKTQPIARLMGCSFTLKRTVFVHRVYDSRTNVAKGSTARHDVIYQFTSNPCMLTTAGLPVSWTNVCELMCQQVSPLIPPCVLNNRVFEPVQTVCVHHNPRANRVCQSQFCVRSFVSKDTHTTRHTRFSHTIFLLVTCMYCYNDPAF